MSDSIMHTYHIPHGIPLKTKLLREIEEDVFDFLLRQRDLPLCTPGRVGLPDTDAVVVDECWSGGLGDAHTRRAKRLLRGHVLLTVNIDVRVGVRVCCEG